MHAPHGAAGLDANPRGGALGLQQRHNFTRRTIAEELARGLFVVPYAVPFHQRHEIPRPVARQRRFDEMGIGGKKMLRPGVQIGEVAAAAAGDQDLAAHLRIVFQHHHSARAFGRFDGAHQAGRARADHQYVNRVRRQRYLWQQIWLEINAGAPRRGVASAK